MNNIINSKLLEMLSSIDKNKLNQLNNVLNNISKDDLNTIITLLEKNNNQPNNTSNE